MGFRKILLSVLVIIFVPHLAEAQNKRQPHSQSPIQFRAELSKAENDAEKLRLYKNFVLGNSVTPPEIAFSSANEILKLSDIDPEVLEAYAASFRAKGYFSLRDDSTGILAEKAIGLHTKHGDHKNALLMYNLLGNYHQSKGEFIEAEATYLDMLDYIDEHEVIDYPKYPAYGNLGRLYRRVKANDLAVEMYQKLLENTDDPFASCNAKSQQYIINSKLNDLTRAEEELLECVNLAQLPPPLKVTILSNLSLITMRLNDEEKRLTYLERASELVVDENIPTLKHTLLARLGALYIEKGMIRKADSIGSVIQQQQVNPRAISDVVFRDIFFARLNTALGNNEQALSYADHALEVGKTHNLVFELKDVYDIKAKALQQMGNQDEAIEVLKQKDVFAERVMRETKKRDSSMVSVKLQLRNYDQNLAMANQQIDSLKVSNVTLVLIALGLGIVCFVVYQLYDQSKKSEKEISSELARKEEELIKLGELVRRQNQKLQEREHREWVELNSQTKLPLNEIRFIQSDGNYVKFYLLDKERAPIMERNTLKEFENILPDELFFRIHRTVIVNLQHVSFINNEKLFLKDNTELKISRRMKKKLVDMLD